MTTTLADRLARPMFALAAAYLLAVAGLIHRADTVHVTGLELHAILFVLVVLWPVFAAEAVHAFLTRDRTRRGWPHLVRALLVCFFPPYRLGRVHPATGQVWLPRLGWQTPGRELALRLERAFGLPLLLFALLVLPVLAIEYKWKEVVAASVAFSTVLHVCLAVGFAAEFLLKVEASGRPVGYLKEKWLDLAIVVLPTLEYVLNMWANAAPVARLLQSAPAASPQQLSQMGRMYRLRGLLMKGWHALLALELLARLVGDTPKKRLARLEAQIAVLEDEVLYLRKQADTVRAEMSNAPPIPHQ
jgi:hypothetical protein